MLRLVAWAALAAVGLASGRCGRGNREAPVQVAREHVRSNVLQAPDAPPSVIAPEPPAPPPSASASAAPVVKDPDRPRDALCGPEVVRALERGLGAVVADPAADTAELARSDAALAHAILAYAAHRRGEVEASARAFAAGRARLGPPFDQLGDVGAPPNLEDILRLVRFAREELEGTCADPMTGAPGHARGWEPPAVACGLFVKHPAEAVRGWGWRWGSTRDGAAVWVRAGCLDELSRPALGKRTHLATGAGSALATAMYAVVEMPPLGTMWRDVASFCLDHVRDAPFVPPTDAQAAEAGERLRKAVAAIGARRPLVPGRMGAFRGRRAAIAGPVGEAICALQGLRGEPADAARCRALGEAATDRGMAQWLEANTPKPGQDDPSPSE
jgi:hypothetical protein